MCVTDLRDRCPGLPFLILTAQDNVGVAVDAMRAGATDFLSKPIAPDRLLAALHSAVSTSSDPGELRPLAEKMPAPLAFEEIVGSAPQFRAALALAAKAARARLPILIDGETGAGQEASATAITAAPPPC